MNKLNLNKV